MITKTRFIKKNNEWIAHIKSLLKFSGLYKKPIEHILLILQALIFLVEHKMSTSETNAFLYRLMHSYQNNFVFFAFEILKNKKNV